MWPGTGSPCRKLATASATCCRWGSSPSYTPTSPIRNPGCGLPFWRWSYRSPSSPMRCEWRPPASCPRWTRVRLTRSPAASSLCCAWPCWSRCAACSTPYMPDTMRERRLLLAPMFLVAQFALAHWAAGGERPPAPPDLSRFPAGFGEWKQLREDPMAADTAAELGADRVLSRTYVNRSASLLGSVLVLWYQSQRSEIGSSYGKTRWRRTLRPNSEPTGC